MIYLQGDMQHSSAVQRYRSDNLWLCLQQLGFSRSPPALNLVVTSFMFCLHVKLPLPPGNNPIAVNK